MEESLGVSLVERNNRRVFLTSLGEEVVERARAPVSDALGGYVRSALMELRDTRAL